MEEQRKADNHRHQSKRIRDEQRPDALLKDPGAWTCPVCRNENFASRRVCRSNTCHEKRPSHVVVPPKKFIQNPSRPEMKWAKQASAVQISANETLRKRFLDGDTDLTEQEVERAKILRARDERKRKKKQQAKKTSVGDAPPPVSLKSTVKIQTKRNKALRKRFAETGEKGMSAEDIARYQLLVDRDKRKQVEKEQKEKNRVEPITDKEGTNKRKKRTKSAVDVAIEEDKVKSEPALTKDERKSLRKRYKKSGGEGMSQDDIDLAKSLIQQKKEKKKRRKTT